MDARILVLAIFTTAALSGCLAGAGETIGAKELFGDASKAAEAWLDDPVLIGVASIEPFKQYEDPDGEGAVYIHLDDDPGDGRAPGWVYLFAGEDRIAFIAIASGLGVLAEGWEQEEDLDDYVLPLEGWKLDSPEVARILADEPEWPDATDDTSAIWELEQTEDGPVWHVYWETFNSSHYATVHAGDGTVLDMGHETWETGSWSSAFVFGSTAVTAATPADATLEWYGGNGTLELSVEVTGNGLGDPIAKITGPDGVVFEERVDPDASAFIEDLPEGVYDLQVSAADPATLRQVTYYMSATWQSA